MMWRLIYSGLQRLLVLTLAFFACVLPVAANQQTIPHFNEASPTLGQLAGLENTSSPSSPNLVGGVVETDYILDSGDLLYIKDENMGELEKGAKILNDGTIALPLVGQVQVSGLSLEKAEELINEKYRKYFQKPAITVTIAVQRPVRVYITGAVTTPGIYLSGKHMNTATNAQTTLGDSNLQLMYYRMYVSDAIILAGGLKPNANVQDIVIQRTYPKPQVIHINLMDLLSNANIIQDLPLNDKDVVIIQELPQEQIVMNAQWQTFSRSNLSHTAFKVNVLGAVTNPGMYEIRSNDTALSAIASAGGFNEVADQNAVFILRTNSAGQVFKRRLDLKDKQMLASKSLEEYAMLLPNDVVFVDESAAKKGVKTGERILTQASGAAIFTIINRMFAE